MGFVAQVLLFIKLQISGDDPELRELIEAYQIAVPSVRVFRRGIMADYRGPLDSEGMAKYILEDAKVGAYHCYFIRNLCEYGP